MTALLGRTVKRRNADEDNYDAEGRDEQEEDEEIIRTWKRTKRVTRNVKQIMCY